MIILDWVLAALGAIGLIALCMWYIDHEPECPDINIQSRCCENKNTHS